MITDARRTRKQDAHLGVLILFWWLRRIITMSLEANKKSVRRFFEEMVNQGNLDAADEIFAADFGRRKLTSQNQVLGPLTVEEMVAEGDKVIVRVTFRGTHEGEFIGIPATGKWVEVSGAELAQFKDGKIIGEGWHFMSEISLLKQLGVLPQHH
jgi:predicted ester cyclase